jgi:hypothetical protein
MEIDPKLLTATGKKKLKKIISECGPLDYSGLAWSDFQNGEDYYKFRDKWNTHQVLREIFDGSGVEENEDYDCGFDNLSYNEVTIYTNIAKIIIGLRNQIEDAAQTAGRVSRRLDGDWD